mgnify:CR=1 FL=1
MKQDFLNELLGGIAVVPFVVAVFYAFVGATLNLLIHSNKRDIDSPNSPKNYSYQFLFRDNWKRIAIGIILILIVIRFSQEMIGQQLTMYLAFIIGFSVDRLAGLIKKIDNK